MGDSEHLLACPRLADSISTLSDDVVTDRCKACGELVRHRPHHPPGVSFVCIPCLETKLGEVVTLDLVMEMIEDGTGGITDETAAEIKDLLKRKSEH